MPSVVEAPDTDTVGVPASSSRIVASPSEACTIVLGTVKASENRSLGSTTVSPSTGTVTEAEVCPLTKLSVPLVAV